MKRNGLMIGLMLASLGFSSLARSQETIPPAFDKDPGKGADTETTAEPDAFDIDAPKQVQVQVEFVEMSHESMTKLLFMAKPSSADATKLRRQVQELVAKNEAKVLETQIMTARSGLKATCEAIHEIIYPTEYYESIEKKELEKLKEGQGAPVTPFNPTAFETRNVGSTLEIEPTIGEDNNLVELRFTPELVWHTGDTVYREGKDSLGNPFKVTMPDFCTIRLNTQLTCLGGQYSLAGTVSPKNDKGDIDMTRKVMVFLKCDILIVK